MKLSHIGELALLERVKKRFIKKTDRLVLGIGDDAAVVRYGKDKVLLTTDMMVEDIHFNFAWTTPYQLGFKLVSVNVSDIYAMGGKPDFMLFNFAANKDTDIKVFTRLYDGIEDANRYYGLSLVGGDTSAAEKMVLSATVTGSAAKFLGRNGARPGDKIYVTGTLGDAACGLELMKRRKKPIPFELGKKADKPFQWGIMAPLVKRHLMPTARKPSAFLNTATSMMDISDGLLMDLSRLCKESGTGARIDAECIPLSKELTNVSKYLNLSSLDLALTGGEDYELLFTAPKSRKMNAFCIGEITESGIKIHYSSGESLKVSAKGYQHFKV